MAITNQDIKLLESERLTDTDDGGGRATGREIKSGEINALFPPIDRIDQAFGEFSAKKVFGGPQTFDTSTYYGAHSAIIQDAADPNINVLMVDTKSDSDTQRDLKNFVESYQVKSTKTLAQMWGDHLQHQQTVILFQPLAEEIPAASDVLFLVEGNIEQAVRIRSVSTEIRDVSEQNSIVRLRRIALDLFNPLESDFTGGIPTLNFSHSGAEVYTSRPSSGVKYYGVKSLEAPLGSGSSFLKVDNPFLSLAPASKRTEPLIGQEPYEAQSFRTAITDEEKELNVTLYRQGLSLVYQCYSQTVIAKGARIVIEGNTYTDRGDGVFISSGGGEWESFTLDYSSNVYTGIRKSGVGTNSSYAGKSYGQPACLVSSQISNAGLVVDSANQRTSYIFDLFDANPRFESIKIQYRVLGHTYYAKVNGAGNIEGDASGRIDSSSLALQVTLFNMGKR
ncbi:hypothetical protein N9R79_12225 [Vibrio sp.]|nr:hypothetical protein [Vibrio sp.]